MKRFLILSTSLLIVLGGCAASAANATTLTGNAEAKVASTTKNEKAQLLLLGSDPVKQTLFERLAAEEQSAFEAEKTRALRLHKNALKIGNAIAKLKKQIGHTPYVYAGSTTGGWDCSGMTRWAYSTLGVDLYHGATVQAQTGKSVDKPKAGDLVVFRYNGYSNAYHVGIYLSEDKMIHAGGKAGDWTEIRSISAFAGNYSEVSYTRILPSKKLTEEELEYYSGTVRPVESSTPKFDTILAMN